MVFLGSGESRSLFLLGGRKIALLGDFHSELIIPAEMSGNELHASE